MNSFVLLVLGEHLEVTGFDIEGQPCRGLAVTVSELVLYCRSSTVLILRVKRKCQGHGVIHVNSESDRDHLFQEA
jgi:hypothetical protein